MVKIFLARHGQDQDNALNIMNGLRDLPLTDLGIKQSKALAQYFLQKQVRFKKVYSSPLLRAKQTADIICSFSFQPKYSVMPLIIERDFGILTGKSKFDIAKYCRKNKYIANNEGFFFFDCRSAESIDLVQHRAALIIDYLNKNYSDCNVLLVSHGTFAQIFYSVYYQVDLSKVVSYIHLNNTDVLLFEDKQKEPKNPFFYRSS